MRTIPTDSTDARELREAEADEARRDAEHVVQLRAAARAVDAAHEAACAGGWLGLDADERPRPCPRCRPHLLAVACHTCGAPAQSCTTLTAARRGPCCDGCDHDPPTDQPTRSTPTRGPRP